MCFDVDVDDVVVGKIGIGIGGEILNLTFIELFIHLPLHRCRVWAGKRCSSWASRRWLLLQGVMASAALFAGDEQASDSLIFPLLLIWITF